MKLPAFLCMLCAAFGTGMRASGDELSGTMELLEVVEHERDPWHDFRTHMLNWWIDEHEHQIELLRGRRFTDAEQRADRDEQVSERRSRVNELKRLAALAEGEARKGMVELRGWDAPRSQERSTSDRRGGAVVIECRGPMMQRARRMKPGEFVAYIVEPERLTDGDGSVRSSSSKFSWETLRPNAFTVVRAPAGWVHRDATMPPLWFETVDVTTATKVDVQHTLYCRLDTMHSTPVIEARLLDQSIYSPPVRRIELRIELIDPATGIVEKDLTANGPLALQWLPIANSIGLGGGTSGEDHLLRRPYPAPPAGKEYRFTVQQVLVQKK